MAFRDGPFENIKVPLAWTAAVAAGVGLIAALFLIVSDREDVEGRAAYGPVRAGFETVLGPIGGVLAAPVRWAGSLGDGVRSYFFAVSENRRLKAQIAELEPWRDQALALKNVNARYERMLGLRSEPPVPMATARAVLDSRGPFANARLLDAGSSKGIHVGNPAVNEHGLVGRIAGVSPAVSRMLLVTDVASRIPVLIDRTDARAVMTGDGSGNPRLEYSVQQGDAIRPGDRVLSSGDGGELPRGIPIGVAAKGVDGSWRVKLFSDRGAIDFVRVLLFDNLAQSVDPAALNSPPLSGLPPTPPTPTPTPTPSPGAVATGATPTRPTARPAAAPAATPTQAPPGPAPTPAQTAAPTTAAPTIAAPTGRPG